MIPRNSPSLWPKNIIGLPTIAYLFLAQKEDCTTFTADKRFFNAIKNKVGFIKWIGDYQGDYIFLLIEDTKNNRNDISSLIMVTTYLENPSCPPFIKGRIYPLFGKEGEGEVF